MRLSLRFIVPLLLALAAIAYAVLPLVDNLTVRWFTRDLDARATLIANTIGQSSQDLVQAGNRTRLLASFTRITEDERVYAIGFCASPQAKVLATPAMPAELHCGGLDRFDNPDSQILNSPAGPLLVSIRPLVSDSTPQGRLILVHDMSFVRVRSEETRQSSCHGPG